MYIRIYIYTHKTSPAFLVAGFGGAKARMVQRRDRPCNRGEQGQGAPPEKWGNFSQIFHRVLPDLRPVIFPGGSVWGPLL